MSEAAKKDVLVLNVQTSYSPIQTDESRKRTADVSIPDTSHKRSRIEEQIANAPDSTEPEATRPNQKYSSDRVKVDEKFITSLFTGNPDIPSLAMSNVTPIVEPLFSEDSFASLGIAKNIVSNVEKMGITSMTMVQKQTIPYIMEGKDALVKSQTGSGKTLTYALPILHKLMMQVPRIKRTDGLMSLIIVPTRELALQSYQCLEKLCKSCVWVVPGYLVGGEKKKAEKARLRKGVNILIATPGRLIDHVYHTKSLSLSSVRFLVIDEADRLLDMGYERSVNSIMESLAEQQEGCAFVRQTIMLSATLSPGVEKLAGVSLANPTVIDIGSDSSHRFSSSDLIVTPENLSHYYLLLPGKLRLVTLAAFVLSKCLFGDERKMIIFFATQDMVDYHTALFIEILSRYGYVSGTRETQLQRRARRVLLGKEDEGSDGGDSESEDEGGQGEAAIHFLKLHGNMNQQDRSMVFKTFRAAKSGVLLCTDVASRGLDLPRVSWIVQFNPACTVSDYVHRVGRTARVNNLGSALLFLAPSEAPYRAMLEDHGISLSELKLEKILETLVLPGQRNRSVIRSVEEGATNLQLQFENFVLANKELHDMAKKSYLSFVRSYASYPKEVREMFNFKALHLGHYAKSMALRDAPGALGASHAFRTKREMKERNERKERVRKVQVMRQKSGHMPRMAAMSEFDSGITSSSKAAVAMVPRQQWRPQKKDKK